MPKATLLSIVIPTHNRPALLPRAVSSALAGCGDLAEVLVVEDTSKNAAEALGELADDPRLTLIASKGPKGAAGTRNYGAQAARGKVLLFLDDDDELIREYPARVREIASETGAKWGFGQQLVRKSSTDEIPPHAVGKIVWNGGFPDSRVPFRRKITTLSSGFWIEKSLFEDIGGLCNELIIDEDTDICCRLIGAGYEPWYEPHPSVILDRNDDVARLTNRTDPVTGAGCYLRTFLRNIRSCNDVKGAPAFLAFRAQRMILRSGRLDMLAALDRELRDPWLKGGLMVSLFLKRMAYAIQGR